MALNLVYAKCGLTNWYHDQVIRNNSLNLDSQVVDALVVENVSGGVTRPTLLHAAALSGGMNPQASGFATIAGQGGWHESKGLMLLRYAIDEGNPVYQSYLNVIGFVHGNNDQGLSENAIFVPQFSWEEQERIVGSLVNGLGEVKRNIAGRVDYLINDGSGQGAGMISLRPTDVMSYTANHAIQEEVVQRIEEEGLTGFAPQMVVASADINRVGVVPSRRGNLNPSVYAGELLDASVGYQNRIRGYNGGDHESELAINDGVHGELATAGHQLRCKEPGLQRDLFFSTMTEMTGQMANRGFSGYTIGDIDMAFPNFNDVLDLTLYDKEKFEVTNFTEYAQGMGTSMITEFVSHEIMMNIMDLMIRHDLAVVNFRGSNCDVSGDGDLANVLLIPYNGVSLKADDFDLGKKMNDFIEQLQSQIFVKLNGMSINTLTPIRIDVSAELFGTTTINITLVDGDNINEGFSFDDGGRILGMETRAFPTFAINNASSMLGTSESALIAGSNYMSNIQQYFS